MERKLYQKFKNKINKAIPNSFWYKIPDTGMLGGKKPFDGFLVANGVPFAIEFKSKGDKPTMYQAYQLMEFNNAGGTSLVFTEGEDMDAFIDGIQNTIKERR